MSKTEVSKGSNLPVGHTVAELARWLSPDDFSICLGMLPRGRPWQDGQQRTDKPSPSASRCFLFPQQTWNDLVAVLVSPAGLPASFLARSAGNFHKERKGNWEVCLGLTWGFCVCVSWLGQCAGH